MILLDPFVDVLPTCIAQSFETTASFNRGLTQQKYTITLRSLSQIHDHCPRRTMILALIIHPVTET